MDLTFDQYIDFINHLFLQEFVDFDYKDAYSTDNSLTIL